MKNILIVSGHPELTHSVANATILDEVETALPDVEIRRLDRLYPDGKFNIAAEQESLLRADVIVWQFPFSWYGLPGLMKKWLDEVFVHGFAHGSTAKLGGKKLILSFTTGAPEELYTVDSFFGHTIEEYLIPFETTARLCNLELLAPVYTCGISYADRDADMAKRDDIVLATKFLPRTPAQIAGGISGKEAIAQSLDQSLKNLGMDYIDLYIYHIWDYNTPIIDVLEALHTAVTAGKVRSVGISNCYAWQLAKANALAEREGLTPFVSVQSHYNLIMREDERELFGLCTEDNIAMTPYSALASGRLSRKEGYTRRATEDDYARGKYDSTAEQDRSIIERVAELAERHLVSMTEISLAWLLTKVTSPVVGATKKAHVDGAVNAVNLQLSPEEIQFLEETYQPHVLTGGMAQNTPQTKDVKQVWMR
ncbi:aldo/keto reductase [Escherichia coli]